MSKSDLGLRKIAPAVWRYGLAVLSVAISTAVLRSVAVMLELWVPLSTFATAVLTMVPEEVAVTESETP